MNNAKFLLQNCHDLSFETKQITSFGCDQRTCVFIVVLSGEAEQGVDVCRRDLKGLDLGDSSVRNFVDL